MTDDLPDIDLSEYVEAFRELDPTGETLVDVSKGPSIMLVIRYEGPHDCLTSGDTMLLLRSLPEELRDALLQFCEVLGNYQADA